MGISWSHLRDVVEMILSWADSLIVMSFDERQLFSLLSEQISNKVRVQH